MDITEEDADAFRREFVAEVIATYDRSASNISPQTHGDAWNAVLKLGIGTMLSHVGDSEGPEFRSDCPGKAHPPSALSAVDRRPTTATRPTPLQSGPGDGAGGGGHCDA